MEIFDFLKIIIFFGFFIFLNLTIVYLFLKKMYFIRKFKSDEELDDFFNSFEKIASNCGVKKFISILNNKKDNKNG